MIWDAKRQVHKPSVVKTLKPCIHSSESFVAEELMERTVSQEYDNSEWQPQLLYKLDRAVTSSQLAALESPSLRQTEFKQTTSLGYKYLVAWISIKESLSVNTDGCGHVCLQSFYATKVTHSVVKNNQLVLYLSAMYTLALHASELS